MYSTIGSGTASQATPQGRRHKRAEVGFELACNVAVQASQGCLQGHNCFTVVTKSAVSDDHPTDKSTAELGMLMLQHVPSPEKESLPWKGEYFDACTDFARTNQAEMKHNN